MACHRPLFLALSVTLLVPSGWATHGLRAGFEVTLIDHPPGLSLTGALAPDSGSPETFFVGVGEFGFMSVHRVDLSDPLNPVYTLVADGHLDTGADDQLDNQFGSIGGLTQLPTGELVIVSNATNFNDFTGQTIFIARDLNADGDFLDVVTGAPEVTELLGGPPPSPGPFGFSGAQARVAPAGAAFAGDLFVVTADGAASGEVFRIQDPAGTPTLTVFKSGLSFGAGIAFDGDDVIVGDVRFNGFIFESASLLRLTDSSSDGDADDAGETTVITDALDGVFDVALGNDGNFHVFANRSDFSGSIVFTVDSSTGNVTDVFEPVGDSAGDVLADDSAAALGPHLGPGGQRLFAVATPPFGLTGGSLAILEPAPPISIDVVQPLFPAISISPPLSTGEYGGALAISPVSPEQLFAVSGSFGAQEVWRIDITDPAFPIYTRIAAGAEDLSGADDVLDSLFGNVAGLAPLPTGQLIIVENAASFTPGASLGDTVFIAEDLNGDGDFLDVVASLPEVSELISSLPGVASDFTGVQAEIGPDGAVYINTSDGGDTGEVIRIADPTGTPSAGIFFESATDGVDFGSGLAWLGNDLYAGDVDDSFTSARLRLLRDESGDGDALDAGESAVLTSALLGVYDLATGPGQTLWASRFGAIERLTPATGAVELTLAEPIPTAGFNSLGDIVFTSTSGSFDPGGISRATLATITNDFGGISFVHLITPSADTTTPVRGFDLYR